MSMNYEFLEGKFFISGVFGEVWCLGLSICDIILDDEDGVLEVLVIEVYEFFGDEDIFFDCYIF